ncbi:MULTISPECIES: DUF58 domain-containing protein [Microbacterium]|uniref:DUF58 domain-containing protein n=1 Tax=Microbacterium TaxID=33882 RepID=UPI0009ED6A4C|nr:MULTISPECIES: DUF58 domain-containing protein [Microbacterium]QOC26466.1 DUF58 domain-containing protein [Microbacterium hominis]QOC27644.1 DUF58 domain-containing protein [Microbacterium hominis]QYF97227.1 DUF58 domain-containing protein [Microbacterium sp. PAMC21962]
MTLGDSRALPAESRLTRTSAGGLTGERTEVTARRGRRLVGAALRASRAWTTVRAGAHVVVQWARATVRPAGALVILAATAGLAAGIVFGWVEAIVAGVAALTLLILGIPFLLNARAYEVGLVLDRLRVVAGTPARATVEVRNVGSRTALPGRIDVPIGAGLVEFGVPLLAPGAVSRHALELPPQRRGVVRIGPATTIRSDPLGLLRREHAFEEVQELFVHPRTVAVPSSSAGLIRDLDGSATRRLVDADMSFHAIREYAPGDARRQIHWKSTAKTGRLMVRQYEESRRSRMAVVLGLAAGEYASDDEFELAVSAAGSLALRAVHDARDLDIVVGAEIPRVVRGRLRAIRHIPAGSPRVVLDGFSGVERLTETMSFPEVCRLTAEANERLSVVVLVAGSGVGLATLRLAALAFPADAAVIAVVCDERAHPRTQAAGPLTVLTIGTIEDLAGLLLRGARS